MQEEQKPKPPYHQARTALRETSRLFIILSTIKESFGAIIATLLLLAGAVYFGFMQGNYMVATVLLAMAVIIIVITERSIRLATKKYSTEATTTPFEGTGTIATNTIQPYPRAVLQEGESVAGWLGPVQRYDMDGTSSTLMGVETHQGAENTLLLNNRQLIAIAFTEADFDAFQQEGVGGILSQLGTANTQASGRKVQNSLLNYKLWPKLMASIPSEAYAPILESHYQWGIPFSQVNLIEAKNTFTNAGVQVHLADGTILKYSTFLRDQITPFIEAAQATGLHTASN